jgi:predicted membrane metal-binding protein
MDNNNRVIARGVLNRGQTSYSYYQDRKEQYRQYYLKRIRQAIEDERVGDYYYLYWRNKEWLQKPQNKIIDISNNETD